MKEFVVSKSLSGNRTHRSHIDRVDVLQLQSQFCPIFVEVSLSEVECDHRRGVQEGFVYVEKVV